MANQKFSITAMIGVNSSALARGLTAAGKKMKDWAKRSMAAVTNAVKTGVKVAAVALGGFAAASVREFANFEQGMKEVFTLMPGMSKEAMGKMEKDVMALSQKMGVVPEEIVPSLYQALSAGVPPDNVFSFLETAIKGAKAGVSTTAESVDALSSITNAYGADMISAAEASDIVFTTIKKGKTTFPELASALYNVTPAAAAAGVGFEDVGAAIATLTASGVPTKVATTQIRQAILSMMAPNKMMADQFHAVGMRSSDLADIMKQPGGLLKAMQMVQKASGGSTTVLKGMFGSVEALQAAMVIASKNGQGFTGVMEEMGIATGATDEAFQTMDSGLKRALEKIVANLKVVMLKLGKAIAPVLEMIAPFIEKIIARMDKIPFERIINGFMSVWNIGLKPTFMAIGKAIEDLPWQKLLETFLPIAGLLIRTVQKLGKIFVDLSPVIIPAIQALAAYFVFLYRKIFLVVEFLSLIAKDLGAVWKNLFNVINGVFQLVLNPTRENFQKFIDLVKRNFIDLGFNIKFMFGGIFDALKKIFGGAAGKLGEGLGGIFDLVAKKLKGFIDGIPGLRDALDALMLAFFTIRAELQGEITALIGAFKDLFGGLKENADETNIFQTAIEYLSGSFGEILVKLVKFITALMKILGLVIKIVIRLLTELAPGLARILPAALKIAGAAIFFLIEGIKACISIITFLLETILKMEPVFMFIVSIVSGFVAAVGEGLNAIWMIFAGTYKLIKEGMAQVAEFFVEAWYKIKWAVVSVFEKIGDLLRFFKDLVYFVLFGGTVTKDFKRAFQFILDFVEKVFKTIFSIFDKLKDIASSVMKAVSNIFKRQIDMVLGMFKKMGAVVEKIFGKVLKLGGKALDLAGKVAGGAGNVLGGIAGKLGLGGGAKGSTASTAPISSSSFKNSLKPIMSKLSSMDNSLKSIDRTLKGKFVNQ
jgi:TP901 family phage tail tape measure protein